MFDINKLKHVKLTKQEYRKHLLDLLEFVDKIPIVSENQAIENVTLFYRLAKELYKVDNESGE